MLSKELNELVRREPFVPFRVVTSSGREFDITDPHNTVVMKSELFIAFPGGESWTLIPLLHVSSIEPLGNGKKSSGNGGRRPKR